MSTQEDFPDVRYATEDGLLALGGDLSAERLMNAYRRGIFPWYNPGEPILWWSPDPRCVIFPDEFSTSRSLRKSIRRNRFEFHIDRDFDRVIEQCAAPRALESGTWITSDMMKAYKNLSHLGVAHSVETWQDGELVGGLYGIAIGQAFFGESMFHTVTDASKAALHCLVTRLVDWGYGIIDCQITSPHLLSLGAREIPRNDFIGHLADLCDRQPSSGSWRTD